MNFAAIIIWNCRCSGLQTWKQPAHVKQLFAARVIFQLTVHHQTAHEYTYNIKALERCKKPDRYQHVASQPETMVGKKSCAE